MSSRAWPLREAVARMRRLKVGASRVAARARFAMQPHAHPPLRALRQEQVERYAGEGFLLVSGLIGHGIVAAAQAAMWQATGASQHRPETWSRLGPGPHVLGDARLLATHADEVRAAAAQLAGEHVATFARPRSVFTINRPPCMPAGTKEWRPHGPHLDFSLPELRHRTAPLPFRIGALTYLTDVQPHGGGTIVWPRSHARVKTIARSHPERYEFLAALSADLDLLDLGPGVELTPSAGDVLFFHPLCVHASSENVRDTPRLALNHKW